MTETLDKTVNAAWDEALHTWNNPSVPHVIAPQSKKELDKLEIIGFALKGELAFMKYPEFQTYLNLERIAEEFSDNPERGVKAISKHEIGHRFCPYDVVTSIILRHAIKKEIESKKLPYSPKAASNLILNLFTDMCINTSLARDGDEDIVWAYHEISRDKMDSKLWRVYGRSMEVAWKKSILPEEAENKPEAGLFKRLKNIISPEITKLNDEEQKAASELAGLFEKDFFDGEKWKDNIKSYARIISDFLEEEEKDKKASLGNASDNIPKTIDGQTEQELAKRLAEIGSNGLPTDPSGLKEFKEILTGFGNGDPKKASITFYDKLSDSYDVMFATRPFGRPRINPFQPIKWTPSMALGKLDVDYSVQVGGRIIPGVNTYSWNQRKREAHGGLEEIVPNLDIYLDSSGSMPNPIEAISLPVLAGFVIVKKAHRKGAYVRSTNFSGRNQSVTQDSTRDLDKIFENLVVYYNGGTYFPSSKLPEGTSPKQAIIITDAFLGNETETAEAITELRKKHKSNKVTIYAINSNDAADNLRNAGAEIIYGTTTDIFKRVIGKASEVYTK